MDEQRNEGEKMEEIMLPGFRFHPTDEELVGFYLKRKVQQRPLSIELIKQLDIYKYDPWDLPKLASGGEKEWYFYCPRDRKYRNSARPNRVTGAGFWKATGTDRPIYSCEGNKCIGLKKSLVFYKGRAAKGIKTDWMMHEFRLPSLAYSASATRFMDKSIPANDSWAICRIFKKTNSSTAQRALSQSWISPLHEPSTPLLEKSSLTTNFTSQNMPLVTETTSPTQMDYANDLHSSISTNNFSSLDYFSSFKPLNPMLNQQADHQLPISAGDLSNPFFFSPIETLAPNRCTVDVSSMLLNMTSSSSSASVLDGFSNKVTERIDFGESHQGAHSNDFSLIVTSLPQVTQVHVCNGHENSSLKNPNMTTNIDHDSQWETTSSMQSSSTGFPLSLPTSLGDTWRPNLLWDSSSFPSEVSSSFSTTKCYT